MAAGYQKSYSDPVNATIFDRYLPSSCHKASDFFRQARKGMKLLSGFQLHPEMTGKKSMVHFIFLRQPPDLILYIAGGSF